MDQPRSLQQITLRYSAIYLVLVFCTSVLGAGGLYLWQTTTQESLRLQSMLHDVDAMRGTLYRQMKELFDAAFLDDPEAQSQYRMFGREIEAGLQRLTQTARGAGETAAVAQLRHAYQEIYRHTDLVAFGPVPSDERLLQRVLDVDLESGGIRAYEAAFGQIDRLLVAQQSTLQDKLSSLARYTPLLLVVPILLAFGLWVLTQRFLSTHFLQPLTLVLRSTRVLAAGEPAPPVPRQGALELVRLADAINQMAHDLAESRKALVSAERQATLGALVPIVAHNIRNPLSSIRATAQILQDPALTPEVREGLQGIMDSCDRLERWTESLLSYLHPLEAQRQETALVPLIRDLMNMTALQAQRRSVRLRLQDPAETLSARIDPELVEQALHGLLVNSIEASPAGGTVTLAVRREAERAVIVLDDEGPGMPAMPQPGSLAPGPTTKRTGTGLGIPFALKVFEIHGGGVQFSLRPEGGTKALLWLPLS
ncbi:MAG: two-component sensor histidine kinase [Betaproteobacteria bacterium]|nr:two-component sensor histidine kinase [Betaproteobacteria bacterium]MDE2131685.1 two-component sensor histidine kinase [Betaproteobacteria bacterium]MDE2212391.1 two-component sensor histidine kinase [Betaproteobacteria bacterium]